MRKVNANDQLTIRSPSTRFSLLNSAEMSRSPRILMLASFLAVSTRSLDARPVDRPTGHFHLTPVDRLSTGCRQACQKLVKNWSNVDF
jgi:hypothetical protein